MKKYLLVFIAAGISLQACEENSMEKPEPNTFADSPSQENNSWVLLDDNILANDSEHFDLEGFGFAIGSKGYLAGGRYEYTEFREYDTETKILTRKNNRFDNLSDPAAFSIGSMGYAGSGTGQAGGGELYSTPDFYQYNPQTDRWILKAPLPEHLSEAIGFSLNGKGYIGVGRTDTIRFNESGQLETYFYPSRSFYEYSPASNCWIKKSDFPGDMRTDAVAFTIGDKAYVGTGLKFDGTGSLKDFWEYDPNTDKWTKKADFPGASRYDAVGFSIGNKGYIGTGQSLPQIYHKDFWEYDPSTNSWTQIDDFAGGFRRQMVYFSTQSKGYVAGGEYEGERFDFWEFDPSK